MNLHKKRGSEDTKMELQIAPLIDVVFLLLIYFMVTASLIKKEGDIAFLLPTNVQGAPVDVPVEVIIEIEEDGTVFMEGMRFASADTLLNGLAGQLRSHKAMARSQRAPFFVNLSPHRNALHKRIIDVMDACAAAGVKSLSFSESL